ncbi:MAG: 50S ribosomal protein L15 [Gemmatimonadota bacterium]
MARSGKTGLHNLRPPDGSTPPAKRVGRGPGSGLGKTAGRGHKGQGARSGESVPPWFEGGQMPLHRRTPKRGFHSRNRTEYRIVNLRDLAGLEVAEITPELLRSNGLIASGDLPVKVLGHGEVERALTVRAHAFSASARRKIEEAGGRVEVVEP